MADASRAAGLKTVVLASSLAVLGTNASERVLTDETPANPRSAYGRSKLAAEGHVARFAQNGGTGVSLRPPLVYGPEGGGNWRLLQRLAATPLPLPFGAAANLRSMISVGNLADAVACVLQNAEPRHNGAYLLADEENLSLAEILRYLRSAMNVRAGLLPVPARAMEGALRMFGRGQIADSLLGDLVLDASGFRASFSWRAPEMAAEAIRASGAGYRDARRRPA